MDFYGTVGARLLITFDEWFEKHVVALRWYLDYIGDDKELKAAANLIWAASRQNMTTKDI